MNLDGSASFIGGRVKVVYSRMVPEHMQTVHVNIAVCQRGDAVRRIRSVLHSY